MSGSQARTAREAAAEGLGETPEADDEAGQRRHLEQRARIQGWKPLAEFKGDPAIWRDADEFLERGEQELPLMRKSIRTLETQVLRAQQEQRESLRVVSEMSERLRSADERAMKRAIKQLEEQRREAIEAGDVAATNRVQAEIDELRTEPAPRQQQQTAPHQQQPIAPPPPTPEVAAWAARNQWYFQDPQLREVATNMHVRLLQDEPDLTVAENLDRVTATIRIMYPNRVPAEPRRQQPAQAEQDEEMEDPALARRRAPAAVASSRSAAAARRPGARSFETMPDDSKREFARYEKMVAGKPGAKPLTKAEWAQSYWDQFEEG